MAWRMTRRARGFAARWFGSRRGRSDLIAAAGVVLVVVVEWCATYRIFVDQRFLEPVSYFGDAHFTAAIVTAAARGDFWPFASKMIPSLGAPFVANWNDFPMTEDWSYFLTGQVARVLGVFGAINLGYLTACVLAGLSLFFVARRLHQAREFAFMGALLYGLSMYAFARGVHHYSLVHFWFLPWSALVSIWAASREGIPWRSGRFKFSALTFVVVGWSNPYYLFFSLQIFALGFLARLARRRHARQVGPALALVAIGLLSFLSVNLDTLVYSRLHGPNLSAIARSPNDVEQYALKPVNFFIAGGNHRLGFMRDLVARKGPTTLVQGEAPAPYLGLAGIALLLGLVVHAALSVGRRRLDFGVACALVVAWLTIGHSVGGENSLLAIAGLSLFRSVNRVSIMIFTFVLLFGGWALPRLLRRVS
jgi:hypothetical protein